MASPTLWIENNYIYQLPGGQPVAWIDDKGFIYDLPRSTVKLEVVAQTQPSSTKSQTDLPSKPTS